MKHAHVGSVAALRILVAGLVVACQPSMHPGPPTATQSKQKIEASEASAAAMVHQQNSASATKADAGLEIPRDHDSGQTPEQRLQAVTKPDMAYSEFRRLALSQGWDPVVDPECKLNMAGESDGRPFCSKFPDSASCKLCDDLPELSSYSSDLYSLMRFKHSDSDKTLEATGWGEIESWRLTGKNRAFVVKHLEFRESAQR